MAKRILDFIGVTPIIFLDMLVVNTLSIFLLFFSPVRGIRLHCSFLCPICHDSLLISRIFLQAWELWNNGEALSLMDPVLEGQASNHVLMRYINVALLCVQEIASDRPTMSEVVSMLTNELAALPSPKQPAFSNVRGLNSLNSPMRELEACSVYEVTLTRLEGR